MRKKKKKKNREQLFRDGMWAIVKDKNWSVNESVIAHLALRVPGWAASSYKACVLGSTPR